MKKALIGMGGHAREVLMQMDQTLPCFVDDLYATEESLPLSKFNPDEYEVMVAVGEPKYRHDIVSRLPVNTRYFSYIHPTAIIGKDNIIEEGTFIGAYTIITTNVTIGKHALLNRGNHVGHDCKIGNYFTASPGATISGNVSIGDKVYVGNNASIREDLRVCGDVTIGMNAAVVKNIYGAGIYAGVPAKKIK